ncbi:reverse transcriptase domain-containing protein [Tanacetum coccineum]
MRTRNSNFPNNSPVTIPRRRNRGRAPNVVEPELRTIVEVAPMADEQWQALPITPTEGYGEAIVIPEINADHFEIKTNLLQLVQASPFHGFERENPHTHINNFKRITSTLKFRDVPNDVIKLMMFPYSLEGAARVWYDKEPPNSILTWEDLVTKFVNQFFPPSKTTHLKNEISRFTQKFEETFSEAWERFKEMLRACPHHGFTELTQVDTFYNGLNDNDQDSLNAAAGGNLLSKTTREALNIIENKSKVRYSRNKSNVSRMNTTSRESFSKTDERIDKLADQISTLVEIVSKKVVTPATVKAVEESCVTCGGAHAYYNCPNTDNNQSSVCAATGTYNQVAPPNRVSNHMAPPGFAPVQNNGQNRYNQNQGQGNNFNRGNNFHGNQDKEQTVPAHIQPPVNPILIPEPDVLKSLPKPNIPYPLRLNDQKFREKASNQIEKIFQIFQDLRFDISFTNALLLMPRFAPTIKSLLTNKDKLFELAKVPLNENCSTMLLKKLPEKLGDPSKFLIPCDFSGMDDSFGEVLKLKKLNHFSSGSTTPLSDSRPSLIFFETRDSLLEEFADELALFDPFPPRNEDFDFEADLREIELLLNRDPSTDFSPKITFDPNPERFTNEPALVCLPPPGHDELYFKKDVQEVNFRIYSNPLFEFDDNYNSSDINTLFKEILEDVESKDSNVSNFDEPVLLNTPLFDEDECFDPGGDINKIDDFLDDYNDSEGDVLEILHNTTHNLFPEVFFDHDPRSLKDEPDNDDLMTEDKVFDPEVMEKIFSPSYVRLSSKDRHYLFFTIVFSFGSEDTIFDPGIYAFHFSSLEPSTSFETSDSLLEEFADELALLDPFPQGNEHFDFEADLREIELLLNRDPSIDFSPTITIDPNPESDDKSFPEEDVSKETFKIYLNLIFEFDKMLEDVESEDSNVSNFDEPILLNTPLFDEDECFDPGGDIDEIDVFLAIDVPSDIMDAYNDSNGDVLEILHNTTHNLFPGVFLDHD